MGLECRRSLVYGAEGRWMREYRIKMVNWIVIGFVEAQLARSLRNEAQYWNEAYRRPWKTGRVSRRSFCTVSCKTKTGEGYYPQNAAEVLRTV